MREHNSAAHPNDSALPPPRDHYRLRSCIINSRQAGQQCNIYNVYLQPWLHENHSGRCATSDEIFGRRPVALSHWIDYISMLIISSTLKTSIFSMSMKLRKITCPHAHVNIYEVLTKILNNIKSVMNLQLLFLSM